MERGIADFDPRQTARELVGDPMDSLSADLSEAMRPHLQIISTFGSDFADMAVARHPLPWSEDHAATVMDKLIVKFDDMIRTGLAGLPEAAFVAMHKQLLIAFLERMVALGLASSKPDSGTYH